MNPKLGSLVLATMLAGCASTSTVPRRWDFEHDAPVAHAAELLRHHPAVRVVGTGGAMKVFLRGSVFEPLVILDGMALTPDPRGVLTPINPRDVAEIRVLTDPADLTFYGVRGANGVIVIRTRLR
jgi:TonB-dependent SusC/RagA subfamily outer membrane receptor